MAIGTVEFDLSLVNPENGEYLTARAYTVEGVNNVDGTPRLLSIGQLVMAICLQRAAALENGYTDPATSSHVDGIVDLMEKMNQTSARLESLTDVENQIVDYFSNEHTNHAWDMSAHTVTTGAYAGQSIRSALRSENLIGVDVYYVRDDSVQSVADVLYSQIVEDIESKMDENNSFSQQTMIELQSMTSKRDQTYDMISNILKSFNTVQIGIVNNY